MNAKSRRFAVEKSAIWRNLATVGGQDVLTSTKIIPVPMGWAARKVTVRFRKNNLRLRLDTPAGMKFAQSVSREETACGSIASLSGEMRSAWGNPLQVRQTMSPFVVYILVCAASTAPGDCNTRSAIDVVLGPEARNEIMCGLGAQEMFARTAILPRDGEYVKISCVRRRTVAESPGD